MQNSPTIPWETRSDLTSVELGGFNQSRFAVKDVIQNDFYSFGELEFFILQSLRRRVTLEGLKCAIETRFGFTVDAQEVVGYINRLAQDNLLVARKLGDGRRLFRQYQAVQSGSWRQQLLGMLSIKLPGFYPVPLLKKMRLLGWFCFHPATILVVLLAALATLGYAIFSFQTVVEKAPSFAELVTPYHLALMLVGFVIAKILHELGHGLACQNAGHECSEMGLMLLVFLPVLYCDVSDLWTEKSRWKRVFVSLAGVLVELAIATVCFWGWYFSLDGQLSRFLFGMMLVTSVNTLFVNGNPLMRYDGYYALSDLTGIPNLAAVSRQYLQDRIQSWFIRSEQFVDLNRRGLLLGTYAVASFVYRWLIMIAIAWAIWTFFEKQQLATTGKLIVGLVILMAIIPMLLTFKRSLGLVAERGIKVFNTLAVLGLIAVCVYVLGSLEFRHRVFGESNIQLSNAQQIFAPADGQLIPCSVDGQTIDRGAVLARVVNEDLTLEIMTLAGQISDVDKRLEALQFMTESAGAAGEIEFWKKRRSSFQRKVQELQRRLAALDIKSPIAGRVVVVRQRRVNPGIAEQDLSIVEGGWFDDQNRGCNVSRGDNLCYVGSSNRCTGFMKVNEREIELVEIGQPVRVFVPETNEFVTGNVSKISLESDPEASDATAAEGQADLPSRFYRVEFDFKSNSSIRIGSLHKSVILCQPTTAGRWLSRWWRNSMWF